MVSHNDILWVLGFAPISDPIKAIIEGSSKKTRGDEEETKSRIESQRKARCFFKTELCSFSILLHPPH